MTLLTFACFRERLWTDLVEQGLTVTLQSLLNLGLQFVSCLSAHPPPSHLLYINTSNSTAVFGSNKLPPID